VISEPKYLVISYYQFIQPYFAEAELEPLRTHLKTRMLELGIRGTVLLAQEGINSTVVGEEPKVRAFMEFLKEIPQFKNLEFKESLVDHIPFKRTLVKLKKALIPFGREGEVEVNPAVSTGKHLKPTELKKWLDAKDPNVVLIDTRNNYEIVKGTFQGALDWNLRHFRDFPKKLAEHKAELEGKKVVMFCTGGIRCEKATALASDMGLDAYQIDGGILKYFEDVGGSHYNGDCFVFDYRVAVDPTLNPVKYDTAFPDGRPIEALDGYEES
jgi:UPF0176 protein